MTQMFITCAFATTLAMAMIHVTQAAEPQLAHMVYFKVKEGTDGAKEKLVAACKKHLSDHEGTVYFSVGTLAQDFKRDLNDRDFDVALHMVFRNKAAHDQYQIHPRHVKFVDENRGLWVKVRVFDAYVE
jgi:hypothetical protein